MGKKRGLLADQFTRLDEVVADPMAGDLADGTMMVSAPVQVVTRAGGEDGVQTETLVLEGTISVPASAGAQTARPISK